MDTASIEEELGSGDSFLLKNILPSSLLEEAFEFLSSEVSWESMLHRGEAKRLVLEFSLTGAGGKVPRLVAVQGAAADDGR